MEGSKLCWRGRTNVILARSGRLACAPFRGPDGAEPPVQKVGQEDYRQIFRRMERNAFAVRLVGDMAPGIPLDVFDVRPVSRLSDSGNVPR